jgi:UDP-N-acetylglucosamine/UDP-N-acetylgalactosamine diphosphorylase
MITGDRLETLRHQGVTLIAPETIVIDEEVDLRRVIGPKTVIHPGTRLLGKRLLIAPGCEVGQETQATVDDCVLGKNVTLKGGYFNGAAFLEGANMGSSSHVRAGTILEEDANGAHAVGLKQTVLLPFVTLGSLINFCDVLMAGGSSRRDHSEVGSGYIHFNFTPFGAKGDKATASLIGDVPHGVMLRSARIFLGGQGGIVGPLSVAYGTVLAAGAVYRLDHGPGHLVVGEELKPFSMPFTPLRYNRVREKLAKNLTYVGNLSALAHWYRELRLRFAAAGSVEEQIYKRCIDLLAGNIDERIARIAQLAEAMPDSIAELRSKPKAQEEVRDQQHLSSSWPQMAESLAAARSDGRRDDEAYGSLCEGWGRASRVETFVSTVKALDRETVSAGTTWLQRIVDAHVRPLIATFPSTSRG